MSASIERFILQHWLTTHPHVHHDTTHRLLHVGSASSEHSKPLSTIFPHHHILGIDQQQTHWVTGDPDPEVHVVCDITGDMSALQGELFGGIVCCSVLEHVQRPWIAAENLRRHLRPGGWLYVTVPWIWSVHGYPADYWRISVTGMQVLFPGLTWDIAAHYAMREGKFIGFAHTDRAHAQAPFRIRGDAPRTDYVYLAQQMVCGLGWSQSA